MRRYAKPMFWIGVVVAACLSLVIVALLLAPLVVNVGTFKERILTEFSHTIQGAVEAQRIDLSFFPRPSVALQAGKIEIPEKISIAFESLSVYPEIGALLRRKVRIARLNLEAPDVQTSLPDDFGKMKGMEQFSLKAIDDEVASIVAKAASQAPGLVVSIEKGSLTLVRQKKPSFSFRDIDGRIGLPGKRVNIELRCSSNVWKQLSLTAWLMPGEFRNEGHLQVVQLRPDMIIQNLFPLAEPRIEETEVNVNLSFAADGVKSAHAEFACDVPSATLRKGQQEITLKKVSVKGTLRQDGDKTVASLTQLDGAYPEMKLSGSLTWDAASKDAALELNSNALDAESVRAATLFFAGQQPDVKSVFDVVRKGRVTALNITSHAHTLGDLVKEQNFVIRGSMTGGNIFIRDQQLDLQEAKGSVVISNGILEGSDLEGRLENATGTAGRLRIDLKPDVVPFHLEIMIKADVPRLPFYLRNLIEDKTFRGELDLVNDVRGDASGRLVLDRSGKDVRVNVDVTTFALHIAYKRFPYPLEVAGKFLYTDLNEPVPRIKVENLSGKMGNTSFSRLSGEVIVEDQPKLNVTSGTLSITLDEIFPWLLSFDAVKEVFRKIDSAKGIMNLDDVKVKGLLLQPQSLEFQIKGRVQNVIISSPDLPVALELPGGAFEAGPKQLSLTRMQAHFRDSSLTISGVLNNYIEGLNKADLVLDGNVGEQSSLRVSDLINMPRELRMRSPFSLSQAHLSWEKDGKISLDSTVVLKSGPTISVDASSDDKELVIKRVHIRDGQSDAALSFHLKGRDLGLTFDGSLTGATLDRLLERNEFLTGGIKGKLSADIDLDQPFKSVAQGELQGTGLHYAYRGEDPVKVDTFAIAAKGNLFTVNANLHLLEHALSTKGEVDFLRDGFVFDMALKLDGLDVDRILNELLAKTEKGSLGNLPLKGNLRVESPYVKYGKFTFRFVYANIIFDPEKVNIGIMQADLCGIDVPAILQISENDLELRVQPRAKNQDLHNTLVCLSDTTDVSGKFTFEGEVSGKGKAEDLLKSLKGSMEFQAKNGRFNRYGVLAKIFELLSPTGIFKIPDLRKEGFSYYEIKATGNMQDGKIAVKEAILDSPSTDLVFNGEIDVADKKIDAVVLVVPFRTIDRVISYIPLVRYVMANRLIALPVRLTGNLENPDVTPLSPSAVGAGLLDMVTRFFKLPFEVIQPLLPGEEKKESP